MLYHRACWEDSGANSGPASTPGAPRSPFSLLQHHHISPGPSRLLIFQKRSFFWSQAGGCWELVVRRVWKSVRVVFRQSSPVGCPCVFCNSSHSFICSCCRFFSSWFVCLFVWKCQPVGARVWGRMSLEIFPSRYLCWNPDRVCV